MKAICITLAIIAVMSATAGTAFLAKQDNPCAIAAFTVATISAQLGLLLLYN